MLVEDTAPLSGKSRSLDSPAAAGSFGMTAIAKSTRSKRNVFVRDLRAGWRLRRFRLGRALVEAAGLAGASAAAFAAGIASSEQHQIVDNDLGLVLFLASVLVVPGVGTQAAFDIDRATFLEVLGGDLSRALESDQIVPLGTVLPVSVLVLETLVGGQGKVGHRHAGLGVLHFRIFSEIADENDLIDALSHEDRSCA